MSELKFEFSYGKKLKNEPYIIAKLINIQHVVEQSGGGEFGAKWDEDETSQTVAVTITLPNKNLQEVLDGLLDDIQVLLEDKEDDTTKEQKGVEQEEKAAKEVAEQGQEEEKEDQEDQKEDQNEDGDGDEDEKEGGNDDWEEMAYSTFHEYSPKETMETTTGEEGGFFREEEEVMLEEVNLLKETKFADSSSESKSIDNDDDLVMSSELSWKPDNDEESEESETSSERLDSRRIAENLGTSHASQGTQNRKLKLKKGQVPKQLHHKLASDADCKKRLEHNKVRRGSPEVAQKNQQHGEGKISPKREAKVPRRKISCPFPFCSAKVVHLPRHMRNIHKWTEQAAKKVLLKYNIRKRKSLEEYKTKKNEKKSTDTSASEKKKDYHRRRLCPISGCHSIVFRLPVHLQKVHKMNKTSEKYQEAISTATYVPDGTHTMIRWKRELQKKKAKSGASNDTDLGDTSGNYSVSHEELSVQSSTPSSGHATGKEDSKPKEPCETSSLCSSDSSQADEEGILTEQDSHRNPVLQQFENWLQSPDGGKRDEKTARQHCAQLTSILNVIDKTSDIQSLLDMKLVRHVFLKDHVEAKKYEAGTIKSYLMSLRHFFSFLLSDEPSEVSFDPQNLRAKREKVQMWSSSYKRESCTRRWKKLEEDFENQLTPADIRNFEKSEAARRAITLLGQFSDPSPREVTQSAYALVRDFLFAEIFIDNANRPGVLSHMTMTEYHTMTKEEEEWIIRVFDHKMVHVHGPAYIVLDSKLKSWLSIFVNRIRSQVTSSKKGYVFLSWNGQNLKSGQINKAIQSVFKKAKLQIKVTSTSFRKTAVTTVHTSNPELSKKLANLMAHNEATAKKYYLLSKKSKASVEASQKLRDVMRNNDTGAAKLGDDCGSSNQSNISSKQQLHPKQRQPWTPQDLKKVQNAFNEEIQGNTFTLDVVRGKIEMDPELTGMSPRRVYDRLRKESLDLQDVQNESETKEVLPEQSESLQQRVERMTADYSDQTHFETCDQGSSLGFVAPTERNSNIFLDTDISTLRTLFADMIANKPICKIEIERRCESDASGKRLLKNSTVFQLMNRIKYERRMRKSAKQ